MGWILLQRYLEDQLGLVVVGDRDDEEEVVGDLDGGDLSESRKPLLL